MSILKMFAIAVVAAGILSAETKPWVARSNENALVLLKEIARYSPESAGAYGLDMYDREIFDLRPKLYERSTKTGKEAVATLEGRLAQEKDPLVRQDLDIILKTKRDNLHQSEVYHNRVLPYFSMTQTVFQGIRSLLDDQVEASRRPAALIRLRRYAGMEPGYQPAASLAESIIRERMAVPGLLGPARVEIEKDLGNSKFYVDGIGELFVKYKIEGYEPAYEKLKSQLAGYDEFVKKEILPLSRKDFRLPPELYQLALDQYGVDIPPAELAAKAHAAFTEIQGEMQTLAAQIAKERGYPSADYRDVIHELKKQQIVGEAILPHYESRLGDIESIIRKERLVTLPDRPARIRIASAAESASIPAPNMHPPRLVGNQGEKGEFVLPLNVPDKNGKMQNFDDFTFEAASWTLTAHEARPGHELQFDAMVERGVSTARSLFAFNSTNVEGWGLYSEWVMKPYMPLDGQLISLQHRLMRSARAFLDPELHMGKVTPEEALRIIKTDVVLSDAMANQETERYMFRAPGQATSYFYGYIRLLALRQDVEKAMGTRFQAKAFHDFVLSQGLLPPALMRKAVMAEFVK